MTMTDLLARIANCVERGKIDRRSPYPPDLKGEDGVAELVRQALDCGIPPSAVLEQALIIGLQRVGDKFSRGEAFVPELLVSAQAMKVAMTELAPFFESGQMRHKGVVVLGTVAGDLHDIGKNLVAMVVRGEAWRVVDLGVDVGSERFLAAVEENPGCHVGLSALLSTTMIGMRECVRAIKARSPSTRVFLGGAPVNDEYSAEIGADGFFPDPNSFARHLASLQ
jgi:methanogenic corrinoid protein MtbC1